MSCIFGHFEKILVPFKTHHVCVRSWLGSHIHSCLRLMVRYRGTIKGVVITEVTIKRGAGWVQRGESKSQPTGDMAENKDAQNSSQCTFAEGTEE